MDLEDKNYFNPSIYFICKLCQQSFTSVTQLLSHKRSQHTKQELRGIKCIIFEESFVETIVEAPFKSIHQKSDSINCNESAESTFQEHHGKNSCKRNSDSKSSKSRLDVLPNPYVRLTQLTPSEINSFLKTANKSVNRNDIFAQEQNVYNEKNETPSRNSVPNIASLESSSSSSLSLLIPALNLVPNSQSYTISNSRHSHSDSDAQDPNDDREYIVASVFKNSDGIENIQFESIRVVPPTNRSAKVTATSATSSSLEKWIANQKQIRYSDGRQNVILLSEYSESTLAAAASTLKINKESPVTCKLCATKLVTEAEFQNHCENCYLHNKDRHIYCISCNKNFKNPQQLNFHLLDVHLTSENLPGLGNPGGPGDSSGSGPEIEDQIVCEDLPLAEWLSNRNKNFPDFVMLDPDLTQAEFHVGAGITFNWLTCKLCNSKLESEAQVKKHVAGCWPYNKLNHSFCVRCKTAGWESEDLLKHRRNTHLRKSLVLSSPFFCIECNVEFQTQDELDLHENSIQQFWKNMLAVIESDWEISKSTISPSSYPNSNPIRDSRASGADSDSDSNNSGIYLAENIFDDKPETRNGEQDAFIAVTHGDFLKEKHCSPELYFPPVKTMRGPDLYCHHNGEEYSVQSRYKNGSVEYKCRKQYCPHRILWAPDSTIITKGIHNHKVFPVGAATSASPNESLQSTSVPVQKLSHEINTRDSYLSKLGRNKAPKAQQTLKKDYSRNVIEHPSSSLDEDCLPLGEWIQIQKETNPQKIIILEPDPTGPDFEIVSEKNPIKCGLCQWTFTSAVQVRHHAKLCWTQNKGRHVYCAICQTNYATPLILQSHIRTNHLRIFHRV